MPVPQPDERGLDNSPVLTKDWHLVFNLSVGCRLHFPLNSEKVQEENIRNGGGSPHSVPLRAVVAQSPHRIDELVQKLQRFLVVLLYF